MAPPPTSTPSIPTSLPSTTSRIWPPPRATTSRPKPASSWASCITQRCRVQPNKREPLYCKREVTWLRATTVALLLSPPNLLRLPTCDRSSSHWPSAGTTVQAVLGTQALCSAQKGFRRLAPPERPRGEPPRSPRGGQPSPSSSRPLCF